MTRARDLLEEALRAFDELFRDDAGAAIGAWFAPDANLLWPEEAAIIGPEAIGRAFGEFAESFETISYQPAYDFVEAVPPLGVVMGTFIETRRVRETGSVERVHGRVAYVWREDPAGRGWRIVRVMTSRYAPTEELG